MKKIVEYEELKEVLSKYHFEMFRKVNDHKGEMTTLDEKDIKDIYGDMGKKLHPAPDVYIDGSGMVVIQYAYNLCRLESRELI